MDKIHLDALRVITQSVGGKIEQPISFNELFPAMKQQGYKKQNEVRTAYLDLEDSRWLEFDENNNHAWLKIPIGSWINMLPTDEALRVLANGPQSQPVTPASGISIRPVPPVPEPAPAERPAQPAAVEALPEEVAPPPPPLVTETAADAPPERPTPPAAPPPSIAARQDVAPTVPVRPGGRRSLPVVNMDDAPSLQDMMKQALQAEHNSDAPPPADKPQDNHLASGPKSPDTPPIPESTIPPREASLPPKTSKGPRLPPTKPTSAGGGWGSSKPAQDAHNQPAGQQPPKSGGYGSKGGPAPLPTSAPKPPSTAGGLGPRLPTPGGAAQKPLPVGPAANTPQQGHVQVFERTIHMTDTEETLHRMATQVSELCKVLMLSADSLAFRLELTIIHSSTDAVSDIQARVDLFAKQAGFGLQDPHKTLKLTYRIQD